MDDKGRLCLTDMHKAAGGAGTKHPTMWLKNDGTEDFILQLRKDIKLEKSQLLSVARGRNGGTYAHWQIALAYAKWLSPELHMVVNEVCMRYRSGDATLAEEVIDKDESQLHSLVSIDVFRCTSN